MDPLSVAASITGLLTASIEVAKLFAALQSAYDYAGTVYEEIHHFRFILFRLDRYVQPDSMNIARASMIDLEQVVTVLLGCMITFSELEREIKRLHSRSLQRIWWTITKPSLVDLVQRLQNHKGTISSMLSILTCESQDQALNGMYELKKQVEELVRINAEMAHKFESVTAGTALSSGVSTAGSVTSMRSMLSRSSVRTNFEVTLKTSRIYRRALVERVKKLRPPAEQASTPSIQQSWSVLTGISLSEVSNYAVYSLPISPKELCNPTWYTNPAEVITLQLNMPEAPNLLTISFAESLKIALKHNDMETAKTIANYVSWGDVLLMSAVYPTLVASKSFGDELDSLTLFKWWLKCGGDIKVKDHDGRTAIIKAVKDENWGVLDLLIPNGVDIHLPASPLHVVSGREGKVFVLGLYQDIKAEDNAEKTPMDSGLGGKRAFVAKVLLELGLNINARDSGEGTALHEACSNGHREVVEVLLSHGADIEAKDGWGVSALHRACMNGHPEVVDVLLSHGADINARDSGEGTALHEACSNRHRDVVEVLLSHGADIEAKDGWGVSALHRACTNGHREVVEVLLSHWADIEAKDGSGVSALHRACTNGHREVVKILLSHGADIKAKDGSGVSALHRACMNGHREVVKILLSHGADINARDSGEGTALHEACMNGHREVVEVLLSHGADIEAKDGSGVSALHCANSEGHWEVVEVLRRHGADIKPKKRILQYSLVR